MVLQFRLFFLALLGDECLTLFFELFVGDFVLAESLFEAACGYLIDKVSLILQCFLLLCQFVRFGLLLKLLLYLQVSGLCFIDFLVRLVGHGKLGLALLSMLLDLLQSRLVALKPLLLDLHLHLGIQFLLLLGLQRILLQSLLPALLFSFFPLLLLLVDPLEYFKMVICGYCPISR